MGRSSSIGSTCGPARAIQLSHATSPETWWRPWCWDAGSGVRDHLSALDVARDRVVWFDGNLAQRHDLRTGTTSDLFRLPDDRMPIGQACVTPDGRWFVFIHADRDAYLSTFDGDPDYDTWWTRRERCRDTYLEACDLDTGERRTLLVIASPIHHVLAVRRATSPVLPPGRRGGHPAHRHRGRLVQPPPDAERGRRPGVPLRGHEPGRGLRGAQGHGSQAGRHARPVGPRGVRARPARRTWATSTPVAIPEACCGCSRAMRRAATTSGSSRRTTRWAATRGAT